MTLYAGTNNSPEVLKYIVKIIKEYEKSQESKTYSLADYIDNKVRNIIKNNLELKQYIKLNQTADQLLSDYFF